MNTHFILLLNENEGHWNYRISIKPCIFALLFICLMHCLRSALQYFCFECSNHFIIKWYNNTFILQTIWQKFRDTSFRMATNAQINICTGRTVKMISLINSTVGMIIEGFSYIELMSIRKSNSDVDCAETCVRILLIIVYLIKHRLMLPIFRNKKVFIPQES